MQLKGLDKQTLSVCVGMIEAGANPDTLAVRLDRPIANRDLLTLHRQAVVKELRKEQ